MGTLRSVPAGPSAPETPTDATVGELLRRLAGGEGMAAIGADDHMPGPETLSAWASGTDDLAAAIASAREAGFVVRGERMVENAKAAREAALGRLAFDAERWYLGKVSRAFAEKPGAAPADPRSTGLTSDEHDDIFAPFAAALERAARAIASGAVGTVTVADDGAPGADRP